ACTGGCCVPSGFNNLCVGVGATCTNITGNRMCMAGGSCAGCGALGEACCPNGNGVCTRQQVSCPQQDNLPCAPRRAPGQPRRPPSGLGWCAEGHACTNNVCS